MIVGVCLEDGGGGVKTPKNVKAGHCMDFSIQCIIEAEWQYIHSYSLWELCISCLWSTDLDDNFHIVHIYSRA